AKGREQDHGEAPQEREGPARGAHVTTSTARVVVRRGGSRARSGVRWDRRGRALGRGFDAVFEGADVGGGVPGSATLVALHRELGEHAPRVDGWRVYGEPVVVLFAPHEARL